MFLWYKIGVAHSLPNWLLLCLPLAFSFFSFLLWYRVSRLLWSTTNAICVKMNVSMMKSLLTSLALTMETWKYIWVSCFLLLWDWKEVCKLCSKEEETPWWVWMSIGRLLLLFQQGLLGGFRKTGTKMVKRMLPEAIGIEVYCKISEWVDHMFCRAPVSNYLSVRNVNGMSYAKKIFESCASMMYDRYQETLQLSTFRDQQ